MSNPGDQKQDTSPLLAPLDPTSSSSAAAASAQPSVANAQVLAIRSMFAQQHEIAVYRRTFAPGSRGIPINVTNLGVTDPIDADSMVQLLCPTVNGGKDADQQGVHIQWLSDDERLLLPSYISAVAKTSPTFVRTKNDYLALRHLVRLQEADIPTYLTRAVLPVAQWTDEEKKSMPTLTVAQAAGSGVQRVDVFVDRRDSSKVRVREGSTDVASPEEYPDRRAFVYFPVTRAFGPAGVVTVQVPLASDDTYIATRFASAARLNADPRDFGALDGADMTLDDDSCQTADSLALERMQSKLEAYTISCIAALNYARVGSVPVLAWTRGYLVSAGVLASTSSVSNSEVAYTPDLPSKAVLKTLSEYHNADPNRVILASYSIGACFGLQHLARDHTYKQNDPVMNRVNVAYEKALATVLIKEDIDAMAAKRHESHRLVCHPFGLAQCYTLARWGSVHKRVAEAVAIRCDVNPPTLARLGLVAGVFDEACTLPVGVLLRELYGAAHGTVKTFLNGLGETRPAYSALHRMYGWAAQRKAPDNVLSLANTMMPLLAGYAAAFHEIDPQTQAPKASGAALAASLQNVRRDNAALVMLFKGLFTKYVDSAKEAGLEAFLAHQREAITIAMGQSSGQQLLHQ